MNESLDLTSELAHKQRLDDLALMREREKKHQFPVSRYEIKDLLTELNLRYGQYKAQSSLGTDFKVLQTVHDFRYMLTPLQQFPKKKTLNERIAKAKVNYELPVAQVGDRVIYANQDGNSFDVFTYGK